MYFTHQAMFLWFVHLSLAGAALVEVFVEIEGQAAFSHDHQSWLEVWTDDVDRLLAGGLATAALAQV